ncbi:metallophosphoesterase [Paenibacillus sepulcri]|uniref:SEL1-like repeat protein n=1 Tax=Paenibacillus sepulcri TaxID=359917 RepID=A0ABS7C057_9BACL|nr:SEL1-like repeat protein [Paenibacillus sepulcri]
MSDFHLSKSGIKDLNDMIIRALLVDLENFNAEKKIDLVFFTGDLIDQGGKSFNNIDEAFMEFDKHVITPIVNKLGIDKSKFLFVPGNHDIDRYADDRHTEIGLSNDLNDEKKVIEFIDANPETKIKRILPFKRFEKLIHSDTEKSYITNFQSNYIYSIDGFEVGVSALNTSWRCYDSSKDHGSILLGNRQLTESRNKIDQCKVKIALMHHQFDLLKEFDMEAVKPFIEREYDMVFCGHVHRGSNYNRGSECGDVFMSVAPSNTTANIWNDDQRYLNGYSIIDFNPTDGCITVQNRKYSRKHESYFPDSELAPPNGTKTFYIKNNYTRNIKVEKDYSQTEFDNLHSESIYNSELKEISTESIGYHSAILDVVSIGNSNDLKFSISKFFNKYMKEMLKESKKYSNYEKEIESCLLVMDRLLNDLGDNGLINCVENIDQIFLEIEGNDYSNLSVIKLFNNVDIWLKYIYCNMPNSNRNVNEDIFDIIYPDTMDYIDDDFIETILWASKETFQYIRNNQLNRLSLKSSFSLIREAIILFSFPVIVNLDTYKHVSASFDINLIESKDIVQILTSIKEEYTSHLNFILGREEIVRAIINNTQRNKYTIIRGIRDVGKSAIISSVMSVMESEFSGPHRFLPIVYSFKYSNNLLKFILAVIEQCNVRVINKIQTKEINQLINPETNYNASNEVSFFANYKLLKPYFIEALSRVSKEVGRTLLIIDSLEFVENMGDKIKHLLEDIPSNCSALLVTGSKNEGLSWLFHKGIVVSAFDIDPVNRKFIPFITKLSDDISGQKAVNDKIYHKTKGKISEIKKIVSLGVDLTEDNIDEFILDNSKIDLDIINAAEASLNNAILEESLLLLSVFESIEPIALEYIQSYLEHRGIQVRMPTIKKELKKIESVISDLRFGRLKFVREGLALYLLTTYFSKRDIEHFLAYVFEWISSEDQLAVPFVCEFIRHLETGELIKKKQFDSLLGKYVDKLVSKQQALKLFSYGKYLFMESNNDVSTSLSLLRRAASEDNIDSMIFVALAYIDGKKVDKNLQIAEENLRRASDLNDGSAKAILGVLILEREVSEEKLKESNELLEQSAKLGDKFGKLQLAIRLLVGKHLEQNIERADQLLSELLEESQTEAIRIMGTRYLYGHWIHVDIFKGKDLLDKAITQGSLQAKLTLAKFKIRAGKSDEELQEGIKTISELIVANNKDAKKFYAEILIAGPLIIRDVSKGMELLKDLVNEGVDECKLDYAMYLFQGEFTEQNIEEAKQILQDLIERDYIDAKTYYGELLIDGEFYDKNPALGLSILHEVSDIGDEYAKRKLGLRYAYGYGIPKDIRKSTQIFKDLIKLGDRDAAYYLAKLIIEESKDKGLVSVSEAFELLEKAETAGSLKAKVYLGELYIDGEFVDKDVKKGINYFNSAIELNDSGAMRELGYRYLNGVGLKRDEDVAVKLLTSSINHGNLLAKTILGHGIVQGKVNKDMTYGITLLEEAALEDVNAMRILGMMLLSGDCVKQDKEKGEELSRKAYSKGDNSAGINLVDMLLDGLYLVKNTEEGKAILYEMTRKGYEKAIVKESNRLIYGDGLDRNIILGISKLNDLSNTNIDAMYYLGRTLIIGPESVTKDFRKGERLLREAEEKNHRDARILLVQLINDNMIKSNDETEVIQLLKKACDSNDYKAMQILADLYLSGEKVEKNNEYAIELLEESIMGEDDGSLVNYGIKLIEGEVITQDIDRGILLLQKTLVRGYMKGKYELAKIYLSRELITNRYEEGLELILQLVEDGNENAKEYLAKSLAFGDKMDRDVKQATQLFEELIQAKRGSAVLLYSELLFDGNYLRKDTLRAERLIRQLIQEGNQEAGYNFATRLIDGNGVQKHVSDGINRLKKLADSGLSFAMLDYGIRLKKGIKVGKNILKGKRYMDRAISSTKEYHSLGIIAYNLNDYETATELFVKSFEQGFEQSGTSLAYMLRRNEVRGNISTNNFYSLLEKSLKSNSDTAIINLAISFIDEDSSNDSNWKIANSLIEGLFKCSLSTNWWYESVTRGKDVEGHLVLGLLVKHGIINDPDNLSYLERFNTAMSKWGIPQWMMV